tara:strand:+ start:806 stop:1099 length:294 start_codon:yes stop_codon:yes gene_type:complete
MINGMILDWHMCHNETLAFGTCHNGTSTISLNFDEILWKFLWNFMRISMKFYGNHQGPMALEIGDPLFLTKSYCWPLAREFHSSTFVQPRKPPTIGH